MNLKNISDSKALVAFAKVLFVTLSVFITTTTQVLIKAAAPTELGSAGSCHWREIELCCVGAASLFQNPNGVPVSELEFKRQCEYLDESANCFEDYGERCLTKGQFEIIRMLTGEIFEIEKEFCKEGSEMRAQYAKHVDCFRDVQKNYQRHCVLDLQVALEPIHKLDVSARLSTGCCGVNRFRGCIMSKIEEECGEEAEDLVQVWLTRAFGNIVNVFCRNYDPQSDTCLKILPSTGTKPHNGRNTSAISRVISSHMGVNMNLS